MTLVQTLTYVEVDGSPVDGYATAANSAGKVVLDQPWSALPEPFLTALHAVVDNFDGAQCEAPYCPTQFKEEGAAPAPIGFTLAGDADEYQMWHFTTLVRCGDDGPVLAVCEDCTPPVVYHAPTSGTPAKEA